MLFMHGDPPQPNTSVGDAGNSLVLGNGDAVPAFMTGFTQPDNEIAHSNARDVPARDSAR
jgi:hypothetical protein